MQTEDKPKRSVRQLKAALEFPLRALGIVAEVRRPRLAAWIASGKVPDRLLSLFAQARPEGVKVEGQDYKDLMAFYLELAKDSFLWPRLVDEPDPDSDDEMDAGIIDLADLGRFGGWVLSGCQGLPVQTTSGVLEPEALNSFRPESTVQGGGADGGQVQTRTGEDVGDL